MPENNINDIIYTNNIKMNDVFKSFINAAECDGIWVSIDANELLNLDLKNRYYDYIEQALNLARLNCIETTSRNDRFIKFRSRSLQNQLFIKIEYSSENKPITLNDKLSDRIKKNLESIGGYFKLNMESNVGNIKLAFPN